MEVLCRVHFHLGARCFLLRVPPSQDVSAYAGGDRRCFGDKKMTKDLNEVIQDVQQGDKGFVAHVEDVNLPLSEPRL